MNDKRLTVAIITRNRALLLQKALQSLTIQTRPPDEVLIIDNASTDVTKAIVDQMSQHLPIHYVYEDQNNTIQNAIIGNKQAR